MLRRSHCRSVTRITLLRFFGERRSIVRAAFLRVLAEPKLAKDANLPAERAALMIAEPLARGAAPEVAKPPLNEQRQHNLLDMFAVCSYNMIVRLSGDAI